jgi:hypothetical protein
MPWPARTDASVADLTRLLSNLPPSVFHDGARLPGDDALRHVLGGVHTTWGELLGSLAKQIGPMSEIWKLTGGAGWGLRVVQRDRVILYMTPQPRQFVVSFALGERAVAAARKAELSTGVLEAIEAAPRFAEGRGVRITVRDNRDVEPLTRLARIKSELSR